MGAVGDFEIIQYSSHTASALEKQIYTYPSNNIPSMVTSNGEMMVEGAAICLYLARLYGRCLPDQESEADYYK